MKISLVLVLAAAGSQAIPLVRRQLGSTASGQPYDPATGKGAPLLGLDSTCPPLVLFSYSIRRHQSAARPAESRRSRPAINRRRHSTESQVAVLAVQNQ